MEAMTTLNTYIFSCTNINWLIPPVPWQAGGVLFIPLQRSNGDLAKTVQLVSVRAGITSPGVPDPGLGDLFPLIKNVFSCERRRLLSGCSRRWGDLA